MLDAHDVDPGDEGDRQRDDRDAGHASRGARPEESESLGQSVPESGPGRDASQPRHPAHLEARELTEGLAGVDIGAAGLVEMAAGLRKAEREQQDGEARQRHRQQARRPQQRRGRGRKQIDAASDYAVERESDNLPPRDRASEGCRLRHFSSLIRVVHGRVSVWKILPGGR